MNMKESWDRFRLLESPLFQPLHPVISQLAADRFPVLQNWNDLLQISPITNQNGCNIQFVPQGTGQLPFEMQYEPRCYLAGEIQTRSGNWHDLFNALVWLTFPKAKSAINACHYSALAGMTASAESDGSQRGSVRDTSTLLDESGVVVPYSDQGLAELLRNFEWHHLFWKRRSEVLQRMGFYILGHGLYEKALSPYVGMTGQGLLFRVESGFFDWPLADRLAHLDILLADYLNCSGRYLSTRELSPVPLLGIPGWAPENESAEYYDNMAYFRTKRRAR